MEKLIFLIIGIFLSVEAHAFTLNNNVAASYKKNEVKINVDTNGCGTLSVTATEILDMAVAGVEKFWNSVPTSRLKLVRGELQNSAAVFRTDPVCSSGSTTGGCVPATNLIVPSDILIACNTLSANFGGSTSVIGVTVPNNISGTDINGALILLQDSAGNTFDSLSYDEKVAILAHEIGHAIGLGHTKHDDQLMYYQSIPTRFRLGWDDIDGVSYLYPTEQPVGCGTIDLKDKVPPIGNILTILFGFLLVLGISKIKFEKTFHA